MTNIITKTLLLVLGIFAVTAIVFSASTLTPSFGDASVILVPAIAEAASTGGGGEGCGGCGGDDGGDYGGGYDPEPPYIPPTPDPKPVCTLSASPNSIDQGGNSTLNWTSSHATSATITQGIGSVAVNGSRGVSPSSNTSYTLTVSGPGGTANCNTNIIVSIPDPRPTCTLNANPSNVSYGGSSTLNWSSTNASSASISNGIGSVGVNGTYVVSNITSDRNYVLTVTGNGETVTCSAYATTQIQHNSPSCDLYASRTSIRPGESVSLTWNSSNAYNATLTNFGSVNTNGSRIVRPYNDTSYTLTVTGNGGSRTCTRYIDVYDIPVEHPRPSCTISANPNSVAQGKTAVLNWNSYNAVSATISQLGGYTPLSGNRVVYGNTTTNYVMTVRNAYGNTAVCSTTLGVYSTPVYKPPVIRPYVPVSYVPYTGPEDTAYILGLIAVFVASLGGATVLYRRKLR